MNMRKATASKPSKQTPAYPGLSGTNPFDFDSDGERTSGPARASSAPPIIKEDEGKETSSFTYVGFSAAKNRYKKDFSDSGGLQNQSLQELENYAVYKAEETTEKLNGCLKIAEDMREDAARTLVSLHQQGEQINRAHHTAASIDQDLSRGEKLLGSLGGIFSKTWKPKKNRRIKGPILSRDDSFIRNGSHMEQRQKLGLISPTRVRPNRREYPSEATSALDRVEIEKAKQEDALSDLSNLLGQMKEMAIDMGTEINRQEPALNRFLDDTEEISQRTKGANRRAQHLLGR